MVLYFRKDDINSIIWKFLGGYMEKKIAKNYLYNAAYQILTLVIPLITTPYISRVLGVNNVGIYSYVATVASYFVILNQIPPLAE